MMLRRSLPHLLVLVAACRPAKPARPLPPADVIVSTHGTVLSAPDTLPAGTIRFRRVLEDTVAHNLVVFALAPETDPASLAGALDQAVETPAPVVARGGPESPAPGDTGDVYITLSPGRYLLGCMSRGFASQRHVSAGEWKIVTVVPSSPEAPPAATIDLGLADFAFQAEPTWPAGDQIVQVSNIGTQEHIALIARLEEGHTLKEWIAAEGDAPWSHPLGGVSRLGPGQNVLLPLRLQPGRYILTCLIVDPKSGNLHVNLGMLREITVAPTS